VRKRGSRKSASLTILDLRAVYFRGLTPDLFRTIETPAPKDADFEIAFCQEVLRGNPMHFEALVLLGDSYTRKGEYQKGLELDLWLSRLRPENKFVRYNLACSYALTGQKDKALSSLSQAVELGYRDAEHLRQDHDLNTLKTDPRFQELLERLSALEQEEHETSSQPG
jgi:tetratricopeptide (TPR) repeat protein